MFVIALIDILRYDNNNNNDLLEKDGGAKNCI